MNPINSHLSNINCPVCGKLHNWQQSKPWSPFCSERCKIIDLGEWASENYKINVSDATTAVNESLQDSSQDASADDPLR